MAQNQGQVQIFTIWRKKKEDTPRDIGAISQIGKTRTDEADRKSE